NILDVQGISCNDGQHSDGSAILQATGGDNPAGLFVFNLDDGTNKVGNLVTLNDLAGGINHFTVYYNTINGNTCSKSDSFEVGVPERLTLDLVDSKIIKPTCFGDCDGSIIAKAKGGNNATYFYKWQETGQSGAISTDLCAGTYHVEITDANLCSVVDSVTLSEPEELIVEIDSANTKDVNCSGPNSGQIAVNFTGGNTDGPYTFTWNPDVSDDRLAKNLGQGVYAVTVSDHKGCSDYISYEVKGQQPIVFNVIQRDSIQCYGDKTCVTIDTVSGGAGPGYTFSVNGGPIVPVDSCRELYASDQPYLISVFDSEGCKSEQEFLITQPEQIIVDLGDEIQLDLGDPKTIHLNTNTNISEVIWDIDSINFKFEFLNDLKTELQIEGYANDSIYATVIDQNGCTASGALYVIVNTSRNVYIPNIFSPDGDGLNDEFRLTIGKGVSAVNYMKIYNRWGELMFEEQNINPAAANSIGWDGTYKGKRVNPGVYVYLVEVEFLDGRIILYRGAVTVIR
ncbi:MAG TPA: T9SS type B sorting domain-containing protein, partial [Bacteroidetes bacterium]|nr:T9SS type B sorting domain-containing protein [Bacteroidota bacterium]